MYAFAEPWLIETAVGVEVKVSAEGRAVAVGDPV
jgi:hypothetical protein